MKRHLDEKGKLLMDIQVEFQPSPEKLNDADYGTC